MIDANRRCLEQGLAFLTALTDAQYADPRGEWASVGAQYRHVLEHYQCLLEGLDDGVVDYDARRRDVTIERSRDRARDVTTSLIERLDALRAIPSDRPLTVQLQCEPDREAWAPSTLGRELQFLVSHSVHHYALIKFLLAGDGCSLDRDLGVAPSTLSHLRTIN